MDALDRAGIAFHLVKHETAGGFMADAVAQLTRTPAVLVGTIGPGVTNLVTAVAHAYLDRTPMIVLTAAFDSGITATYTHQVFDQGALLAPITKWSATLGDRGAGAMIDRAHARRPRRDDRARGHQPRDGGRPRVPRPHADDRADGGVRQRHHGDLHPSGLRPGRTPGPDHQVERDARGSGRRRDDRPRARP